MLSKNAIVAMCGAVIAASVMMVLLLRSTLPVWVPPVIGVVIFGGILLVSEMLALRRQLSRLDLETRKAGGTLRTVLSRVERVESVSNEIAARPTNSLSSDIATLGSMLKDLADAVADQDAKIARIEARPVAPLQVAGPGPARLHLAAGPVGHDLDSSEIFEALSRDAMDLYLQPIVSLPQRKVRFYQTTCRLRRIDGTLLMPEEFLPTAMAAGMAPAIDRLQFQRAVRLLHHLAQKIGDVLILMNFSRAGLASLSLVDEIVRTVQENPSLAASLVIELPQAVFSAPSREEQEGQRALGATGLRFAVDHVASVALDARVLAARGVRLVKVNASLLLAQPSIHQGGVQVSLAAHLARSGIDLVAERIEDEQTVVDLLDLDVKFAQGHVFSPPRPVRAEFLRDEKAAAKSGPAAPSGQKAGTPPGVTLADQLRELIKPAAMAAPGVVQTNPASARMAPTSVQTMEHVEPKTPKSAWRTLAKRVASSNNTTGR